VNELIEATNLECAQALREFISDGHDVAYFIGSGLSQQTYPSWRALVTRISTYFQDHAPAAAAVAIPTPEKIDAMVPSDLQDIFQRFRESDAHTYIDCIREVFGMPPLLHNDCLIKILETRPTLIATVNFDPAIEAAADVCHVKIASRFFPTFWYDRQDQDNVPVVMHVHGRFHEQLYDDPDRLILHRRGYRRWYDEGDKVLFQLLSNIFLGHDVVFIGTSLSEPEMESFFRAFRKLRETSPNSRRQIALLPSKAKPDIDETDQFVRILREEQALDRTDGEKTGIQRIRFFSKGNNYPGLHEVLSKALGQKIVAPEPKPFWNEI